MTVDLVQVQTEMENESVGLGIERYKREITRDEVGTPPGRRLLNRSVSLMIPVVDQFIKNALAGQPGRGTSVIYMMDNVSVPLMCLVTVTNVLQGMRQDMNLSDLALRIGNLVQDQVNYDYLKEQAPKIHMRLKRKLATTDHDGFRHLVINKHFNKAQLKTIKWGVSESARLGATLVELFLAATVDVAQLVTRPVSKAGKVQRETVITTTDSTEQWLRDAHNYHEALNPLFMPMVVEPRQWTSPFTGGYLTPAMRQPLIKTPNRNYLKDLAGYDLSQVYTALNALQATQWCINQGVFKAASEVWALGGGRAGMPGVEDFVVPQKLHDPEKDEQAHLEWRKAAAHVYEANTKLKSRRRNVTFCLSNATRMAQFEAFYFAYNLDWRGRTYAMGATLNPQGDDLAKGLLQFTKGVPLGDGGTFWLAVHGANCYGVDKVSFDDRVQWVVDHTPEIIASAIDPLVYTFWLDTEDNPWQFLAFCKEWAGLQMWVESGRAQEDYVSHLPVGLDGSCNGLQNFSMALRDEVGGKATNLVPSDKPSDIYALVAAEAVATVEEDAKDFTMTAARAWQGKVTRKLCKQPTMTMPYGSGQFGFRDQIESYLKAYHRDHKIHLLEDENQWKNTLYLAQVMHKSISKVVVKAREAMDWLQEVATLLAEDGLPVRWMAPSGLPVVQNYVDSEGLRLDFQVMERRVRLTLNVEGMKLSKRKQRQGIAPNYVHSLDAAHLVRSVNYAAAAGVASFSMVHDSFGTHAGHIDTLSYELRRAFVDQYTPDVLGRFRDEVVAQLTTQELRDKVPAVPTPGTLDPELVMQSEYFFA